MVTPDDLSAIRDITDAMGRLERSLRALGDGLELAADTLLRADSGATEATAEGGDGGSPPPPPMPGGEEDR